MPTPINHLVIADEILAHRDCPSATRSLLRAQRGYFLLGSIAPDVHSVSQTSRDDTHFFDLRGPDDQSGPALMLSRYPQLADPAAWPPTQVAFLAGYLSHLLIDDLWIVSVFRPCFRRGINRDNITQRILLHNVLRTHLDRQDRERLHQATLADLRAATIAHLLPFVPDDDLCTWRDLICEQLIPGGEVYTAKIFAGRMDAPVEDMLALLNSPEAMRNEVLSLLPPTKLDWYRQEAVARSCRLIARYLSGELTAGL